MFGKGELLSSHTTPLLPKAPSKEAQSQTRMLEAHELATREGGPLGTAQLPVRYFSNGISVGRL